MIRKVIQISPSTRVVSLPSDWLKKNKIGKGSEIHLDELDNRILISSKKNKVEQEISIDLKGLDGRLFWAYIDSTYIAGYDVINISTRDNKQNEILGKAVKYFPGMMIIEERKNKVIFRDIADNPHEDINKILARIFNMNISLIEDALQASKSGDWDALSKMKKIDYNVNAYISYCFRQLNKFGYEPMNKIGIFHTYIKIVEMLSDRLCDMFVNSGLNHVKLNQKATELLLEIYKDLFSFHFNFNQEKLIRLDDKKKKLAAIAEKEKHFSEQLNAIADLLFCLEELETGLNI